MQNSLNSEKKGWSTNKAAADDEPPRTEITIYHLHLYIIMDLAREQNCPRVFFIFPIKWLFFFHVIRYAGPWVEVIVYHWDA